MPLRKHPWWMHTFVIKYENKFATFLKMGDLLSLFTFVVLLLFFRFDRIISLRGEIWAIKLVQLRHFLLKWLSQARKLNGHEFVLRVSNFLLSIFFPLDFGTVPTVWYILELFRQCGIFWNCSDSVVYFRTVPTVWYILELFRQCGIFWNCSDSVVYFGTVPTVWYILFFILFYIFNEIIIFGCIRPTR
jgi:hypothetical protein